MKKFILAVLSLLSFFYCSSAQVRYYKLMKIVDDQQINTQVRGGQFVYFMDNRCYECDKEGYSVGNGILEFKYVRNGVKYYTGEAYWGKCVFKFNSDYTKLNVVHNDKIYVYLKQTPPQGVETCSLIKSQKTGGSYTPMPNPPMGDGASGYDVPDSPFKGHYENVKSKCIECSGRGYIEKKYWMGGDVVRTVKHRCLYCHGTGMVTERTYVLD